MSKEEKDIAKRLGEAFAALPDSKKERWLGYAEGVADMKERLEANGVKPQTDA